MYYTLYAILVLTTNSTLSTDLKALGDNQFTTREAATDRLGSLPGWTALYFKHYAKKAKDPEVRIRCRRVYESLAWRNRFETEWLCMKWDLERRKVLEGEERVRLLKMILDNLSKLSVEALKLVEAQKFCPIHEPGELQVPLGAKGIPVKITLNGQVVFLCCKDHIKKAQANPDKALAEVEKVKKMNSLTKKQLEEKLKQLSDFSDDK